MNPKKLPLLLLTMLAFASYVPAQTLFSQDFSGSANVNDYINAAPGNGQFNNIKTTGSDQATITGGMLALNRTNSNRSSITRSTDLSSPASGALRFSFDMQITNNTLATTDAIRLQVGSSFNDNSNILEVNTNVYAQLGINLSATPGQFQVRDINSGSNSASFSGLQTIVWVLNNSGATINYTAPDGSNEPLANDTADIWVGLTRVFNDSATQTPSQTASDFKFFWGNGSNDTVLSVDNVIVTGVLAPTASGVSLSGRAGAFDGRPARKALVTLVDFAALGRDQKTYTDQYGRFSFEGVATGRYYLLEISHPRYIFTSRLVFVGSELDDLDFTAETGGGIKPILGRTPKP